METFRTLIGPDTGDATVAQLCVRAAILFLFGIALHPHRRATDLLADHAARHHRGDHHRLEHQPGHDRQGAVLPGLAATLVVVMLHRLLAMATMRWSPLAWLMKGSPVVLVRDGVADEAAMSRHAISRADLVEGLRMEQVERVEDVRLATLEAGGKISVVPKKT
jgi:hypothetical protein